MEYQEGQYYAIAHHLKKEGNKVVDVPHIAKITTHQGTFEVPSGEQFTVKNGHVLLVLKPLEP